MHLEDQEKKLTKLSGRKLRSDPYLHPNKHSPYNLHGWFSYRYVVLILAKDVTSNLPKFPQQKFGQTQEQILNLSKIQSISNMGNYPQRDNTYKLNHTCAMTYGNIRGKVRSKP